MGVKMRIVVGVMGNAACLLLYVAPILTFSTIIKKKSTQEFSCVPYIVGLLYCLLYTWYASPIVSCGWENIPVVTIDGSGILLESSFIFIYLWYASPKGKMRVAVMTVLVVALFSVTALISALLFHNHHDRKVFVGTVGLVVSVAMYGSPLVAINQVIQTKSVKYMPFSLSFCTFLATVLWMVYGLLSHDIFLTLPNLIGVPLGILQLILYCIYRERGTAEETTEGDIEKNKEEPKQVQLVTDGDVNNAS